MAYQHSLIIKAKVISVEETIKPIAGGISGPYRSKGY